MSRQQLLDLLFSEPDQFEELIGFSDVPLMSLVGDLEEYLRRIACKTPSALPGSVPTKTLAERWLQCVGLVLSVGVPLNSLLLYGNVGDLGFSWNADLKKVECYTRYQVTYNVSATCWDIPWEQAVPLSKEARDLWPHLTLPPQDHLKLSHEFLYQEFLAEDME